MYVLESLLRAKNTDEHALSVTPVMRIAINEVGVYVHCQVSVKSRDAGTKAEHSFGREVCIKRTSRRSTKRVRWSATT